MVFTPVTQTTTPRSESIQPPKPRRVTAARLSAWSIALFVVIGALILWTPIFLLCMSLWALPAVLSGVAVGKLVWDYKDGVRPSRRVALFVCVTAFLLIVHAFCGGSSSWLRLGVAIRLWRVGGIERVEQWVDQQINPLRTEWDAMGGQQGLEKLSHDDRMKFLFRPKDSPEWLMPLRSYLPARISDDANGRPDGVSFQLSGWDHGWGLTVLCEPSSYSLQKRWPARLTDRSYVWGNP